MGGARVPNRLRIVAPRPTQPAKYSSPNMSTGIGPPMSSVGRKAVPRMRAMPIKASIATGSDVLAACG